MSIFDILKSVGKGALAVAPYAAPVVSAFMQSSAAKDAAKTQARSAADAIALEQGQYAQNRADLAPWLASGRGALTRLDQLLGLTAGGADNGSLMRNYSGEDLTRDPSYAFRVGEGSRAIENSAAARGMQLSGATLKALQRYGQDMGSQEYAAAYDRDLANKNRQFNYLTGQSSPGVAANMASMGANNASSIASKYLDIGNARSAGRVAGSQPYVNAIDDVGSYMRRMNLLRQP